MAENNRNDGHDDAEVENSKKSAREEKIKRQEELRQQLQKLRDERYQRIQQRIQLLKTINTQKVVNSLPKTNTNDKTFDKSMNRSTNLSVSYTNDLFCKSRPSSGFLTNKTQSFTNGALKSCVPRVSMISKSNPSNIVSKTSKVNNHHGNTGTNGTVKSSVPKGPIIPIPNISNNTNKIPNVNHSNINTVANSRKSFAFKTSIQNSNARKTLAPKVDKQDQNEINIFKKPTIPKSISQERNNINGKKSTTPKNSQWVNKFSSHSITSNKIGNKTNLTIKPLPNTNNKIFQLKNMSTFEDLAKSSNNSTVINSNEKSVTKKDSKPINTKRWTMASVERLSKPKVINKPIAIENGSSSVKAKAIKINRKSTLPKNVKVPKDDESITLRRSLSTVHFKRLGPDEAKKCFQRTYSVGNLKRKEIEDELPATFLPKGYFLPIPSERKKSVSFLTPLKKSSTPKFFLNTPKPSELRKRLNDWLQKRGKSLSTFHHLKCFDIETHNLPAPTLNENEFDEENKENIEIPDDDSFNENITGTVKDMAANWRQASIHSPEGSLTTQSPLFNNRRDKVLAELTPKTETNSSIDPLLIEALFDLHQLILEDYSWMQCAEWLRLIIRECGDKVKEVAAYWECRAALEEKRGDFVRTVDCFNNALQHGAQPTSIEESLDNLLDKFMKLNLDPKCETNLPTPNKSLIEVKNVFKTSLIRFAIKRQNNENVEHNKYIATPVRRSSRLTTAGLPRINMPSNEINGNSKNENFKMSVDNANEKLNANISNRSTTKSSGRKHLVQLCESLRDVEKDVKKALIFVPNKALTFNDCI